MKRLLFAIVALALSACGTVEPKPSAVHTESHPPDNPITWVLVLINLNQSEPEMLIEGSYDRMDECFFRREQYIPKYPKPGTQAVCIQMK